ncbi:hypothetical protein [Amycolatopsis sp. NPDC058986]|uniref:hypothetical protein n=1 Tax=Actinomycetes TaxID=1760 RepID=UPI00366B33F9
MTGPEHYLLAERYLSEADELDEGPKAQTARAELISLAHVHAALATAAAIALAAESSGAHSDSAGHPAMNSADFNAWKKAAGTGHAH